ncbi:hypothetical protein X975_23529, partial [Stegodyphus mimosarum]
MFCNSSCVSECPATSFKRDMRKRSVDLPQIIANKLPNPAPLSHSNRDDAICTCCSSSYHSDPSRHNSGSPSNRCPFGALSL